MHDRNSEGFSTITPEEARAMVNNPRLRRRLERAFID